MPDAFEHAADYFDPPKRGAAVYHDDPVGFVRDCINWEAGDGPTGYQERNMRLLVEKKRVCVRSGHGSGKTCEKAWLILWFAITRDAAGEDWKCPTTASSWRQLTKFLWPEVRKWARKLNWERIGRPAFNPKELQALGLKLRTGEAFAVACENPATIEGVHADQVFYVYDEAKTIPEATFDASEGAFSGSVQGNQAFAICSSTPGPMVGRFFAICRQAKGLQDWFPVHVSAEDVIREGRMDRDWAEMRKAQWGEQSSIYINRVLGEFATDEADGVIPLAWLEAANQRWLDQNDLELDRSPESDDSLGTIGVDVARGGRDRTVIALRYGNVISELRYVHNQMDTMATAGTVHAILEANYHPSKQIKAIIDVIGIGSGVVDRLREMTKSLVVPFNAAEKTLRQDRAMELGFVNCRSAAWWNLREMLDPNSGCEVAIPPDEYLPDTSDERMRSLTGELTTPLWKISSNGSIQVESKEDIKKRLDGQSTDHADAIVQAFWPEGGVNMQHFATNGEASFFAGTPGRSRWDLGC